MQPSKNSKPKVQCFNEYDVLKQVIVAPPQFMEIKEVINTTQRQYFKENIDRDIALEQHEQFVQTLKSEGIDVVKFDAIPNLNEQVYTRDIGFTVGNQIFVAYLKKSLRKPEKKVLVQWLNEQEIPYQKIDIESIEGGDVMVDQDKIWVGVSDRTSQEAIHLLKQKLTKHTVIPVSIRKNILHLDCTFNILSKDTAILYRDGVDKDSYRKMKESYTLIEVTEKEQFTMGTNVLSIGNKKVISLPENQQVNKELTRNGFHVIEVEFSEIIKSGGSFRCCTLPIIRN
ncbi:dimethylarginine dimethylaminohydrolase family protein [Oceanobacillus senegalensis]|uniref:dimethylarginine dimethylaminohydrolase family protein n=1 Tax=Oceanobacillus senegalensis TaxID=1936063 RepID=UPI000A30A427|nr:arginine deiminase family protein [Oceanobacillus senegalensis]